MSIPALQGISQYNKALPLTPVPAQSAVNRVTTIGQNQIPGTRSNGSALLTGAVGRPAVAGQAPRSGYVTTELVKPTRVHVERPNQGERPDLIAQTKPDKMRVYHVKPGNRLTCWEKFIRLLKRIFCCRRSSATVL